MKNDSGSNSAECRSPRLVRRHRMWPSPAFPMTISENQPDIMKILGESPLDKDAVFEIERFGKKQTINVTPKCPV